MSVITDTQDVYVSTQPGAQPAPGGNNNFNNFRICFSANPLTCGADEYFRLSLTQFNAYRNFYYVNETNNLAYITFSESVVGGGNRRNIPVEIPPQDYVGIGGTTGIATAFGNAIASSISSSLGIANGFTVSTTNNVTAPDITGGTGDRIFKVRLDKNGHGITALKVNFPHFYGSVTSNNNDGGEITITDPRNLNDSYALIGAPFTTTNFNALTLAEQTSALTVTIATNHIDITGVYPMQRTTTPFLYFRIQNAGDNQESANLTNERALLGTHMQNSNIVAKIPVNDVNVAAQYEYLSPYFVNLATRNITELNCRITDQHGRDIQEVATNQGTTGNLFADFTLKIHKVKRNIKVNYLNTSRDKPPLFSNNDALQNNNRLRIMDFPE
tara:strand:+ start:1027 stop:2184 length:1158 start_codon:yes stop_codon:yes gene_type:complete